VQGFLSPIGINLRKKERRKTKESTFEKIRRI
jgi:hypothetical protein